MRHLDAYREGEDMDPESTVGSTHLGHALASIAMILECERLGTLTDTRYKHELHTESDTVQCSSPIHEGPQVGRGYAQSERIGEGGHVTCWVDGSFDRGPGNWQVSQTKSGPIPWPSRTP